MPLSSRIKQALDEARMVVLGVQAVLGFQFRVVLERAFDRLTPTAQRVHLAGLGCLLAAFGFAVAPAAFHRNAEDGDDTPRVLRFTSRMVGAALLPFAASIGAGLFLAIAVSYSLRAAWAVGAITVVGALGLWYGWPWRHRRRHRSPEPEVAPQTPVATKIEHTLTEARMVLPGAQALLGFQFLWFFADGFAALPPASRLIHLAGLASVALATMLLIAPAAFHRIAEEGEASTRFYRYASGLVQASLLPLAIGMSADVYVVVAKVGRSTSAGASAAGIVVLSMIALWWGVPSLARRR